MNLELENPDRVSLLHDQIRSTSTGLTLSTLVQQGHDQRSVHIIITFIETGFSLSRLNDDIRDNERKANLRPTFESCEWGEPVDLVFFK